MTWQGTRLQVHAFWARGASAFDDADGDERDDGSVAPTAPIGSMPFAPEVVLSAMVAMRARYPAISTQYCVRDSFNPSMATLPRVAMGRVEPGVGWVARDHLGINQRPIFAMLENYCSELIWKITRECPYKLRGVRRAGFSGGWLDCTQLAMPH